MQLPQNLENDVFLGMVCQYTCRLFKKGHEANTQTMLDWVRYKNSCQLNEEGRKGSTKGKHFLMPYCSDTEINWDDIPDDMMVAPEEEGGDPSLDLRLLQSARLCTSAIMDVMEIGQKRFKAISARAEMSSMVKPHSNLRKRKRMKLDNPVIVKLVEHMEGGE